jgi:hypothetical protein
MVTAMKDGTSQAQWPAEAGSARLGQPFDCLGNPISAGLRLLALVDPASVLIAVCEGQFLVRRLSGWVLSKSLSELGRLHDYTIFVVLDQFDLDLIANPEPKRSQQILAEAEVTLTAIDREPGAIFDTIDMRKHCGPLAAKRFGDFFGHCHDVATLSC